MINLILTSYCNKSVDEFVKAMLLNPRQNCVGVESSTQEDWEAYDAGQIMEFVYTEKPESGVGTLREFSDLDKENHFNIVIDGVAFNIIRVEDTFKIDWKRS